MSFLFAGWMTDVYGSYDPTFILNGIVIMISGLMLFAIPCLYRCDTYVTKPSQITIDSDDDDDVEEEVVVMVENGPKVVIVNGHGSPKLGEGEDASPRLPANANGLPQNGLLGEFRRSTSDVVMVQGSESVV